MTRDPIGYYPGFFLELVLLHDFPPGFVPQHIPKPRVDMHAVAVRSRATALDRGHTGTIENLSGRARLIVGDASKAQVSPAMLPREDAIEQRRTRYFTGDTCSAGHRAERYVSTRACCSCIRDKDSARRFMNRVVAA